MIGHTYVHEDPSTYTIEGVVRIEIEDEAPIYVEGAALIVTRLRLESTSETGEVTNQTGGPVSDVKFVCRRVNP